MMDRFWRWVAARLASLTKAAETKTKPPLEVSERALDAFAKPGANKTFTFPAIPERVVSKQAKMAIDEAFEDRFAFGREGVFREGYAFLGFAYLAELTQVAEYRRPSETLAREMTREWIKLTSTGEDDKSDKIAEIMAELKRLNASAVFREAIEQDGFFGRSQIYIDLGQASDAELKTPLLDSKAKIGESGIRKLTVVEPIWTYPNQYNSTDPLKDDYFKPTSWWVQGKEIHASRLFVLVSRQVPDILKPAYAFGGLALSQIAKPYVDNWLRTRQSVSDLIHTFSVMVLSTNMQSVLTGGGSDQLLKRTELFNRMRDNRGLMAVDKDSEELTNISVPLGTLDDLQAQSQEHMSAVTGIPLVVLLGITPKGLNASSEGELQAYYSWVKSQQETLLLAPITRLVKIIQIAKWGEVDPEIGVEFEPLWSLNEGELATARKTEAETDTAYITASVLSPLEVRQRLARAPESAYAGIDVEDLPEPPDVGNPNDRSEEEDGTQGAD
jgi:phage-related protein (TIGR01555 family)